MFVVGNLFLAFLLSWVFLICFFSPFVESLLSLLLFRFIVVSIASVLSLFFFVMGDDDGCFSLAVVTVEEVVTVEVLCFSVGSIVVADFFFFFPLLVTGSTPPPLSGWSPVSGFGLSLVAGVICFVAVVAAAAIVVVVVVVVVVAGVTVLVVF